jgi:predicted ArsR family transcriptional regulator
MADRGRPETLVKKTLRNALENKDAGSRFLNLKLVNKGYFTIVPIHTNRRGRPAFSYELTGKGRGYLALAKNWGKIENTKSSVQEEIEELEALKEATEALVEATDGNNEVEGEMVASNQETTVELPEAQEELVFNAPDFDEEIAA